LRQKIIDWIVDNELTVVEICLPHIEGMRMMFTVLDKEYHQELRDQCFKHCLKQICDEVCRNLGCSAEQFYEIVEGTEDKWIPILC
jgi:hypothetical protein